MNGDERGKRLVVLTGAGMSAESGLKTFRDAGGITKIGRASCRERV